MKFEFSAGGIVIKRSPSVNSGLAQIAILLCQHSQHHGWVFPKGLIGDTHKGESEEETAVREVKEETGIEARITKPLTPVTYWYQFEGEKIKKTVHYFLMEYAGGDIANHDNEMEQVEWLPMEEILNRLTYRSDKEAWLKAKKLIANC
ncbi:MAG: hypothetical protein A2698_00345 [Candidatus Levybacteria bacterium RIFCSPHIGHO2_01_FULL_42_15]|nr:MAG: hypothetical protein A2698_00330 [Candidatus Levybacteria bacterium RIFCSPHIGHO2_01_FULL_42_15]OGH23593.1 MAG: hypothetical protein A2698_00345 [Candidatus Levybacteria bacterium RIFCSPHIGHO2_01_FULL_42_15]OGH42540.1 MAG: hypothetical protein A3B53_01005 [Candidatus Levybacteria bacterium RIFCSPLOWO2_01_FULL_42_15]